MGRGSKEDQTLSFRTSTAKVFKLSPNHISSYVTFHGHWGVDFI